METKEFWEKVSKYADRKAMNGSELSKYFGFRSHYLNQRKLGGKLPSQDKIIQMQEIFTDDELFEVLVECDGNSHFVDSFIMSLKVSKEVRERNRVIRKMKRGG